MTPAERDAPARLLATGLVDADVARWGPRACRFTWWNHGLGYSRTSACASTSSRSTMRSRARLDTTWIDHVERGAERPSDYAALVADLHLVGP